MSSNRPAPRLTAPCVPQIPPCPPGIELRHQQKDAALLGRLAFHTVTDNHFSRSVSISGMKFLAPDKLFLSYKFRRYRFFIDWRAEHCSFRNSSQLCASLTLRDNNPAINNTVVLPSHSTWPNHLPSDANHVTLLQSVQVHVYVCVCSTVTTVTDGTEKGTVAQLGMTVLFPRLCTFHSSLLASSFLPLCQSTSS